MNGGEAGYGLEASFVDFPWGMGSHNDEPAFPFHPTGFGLYTQVEDVNGTHFRVGGGAEFITGLLGLELGPRYESDSAADNFGGTVELHVAPFISLLGLGDLALSFNAPVAPTGSSALPHFPFEIELVATLKFPLHLRGDTEPDWFNHML